jgi:protein-L-isoaspartate O-methyltransferase
MTSHAGDLSRRRREPYESTAGPYSATLHIIWCIGFPHVHARLTDALHERPVILDTGAGTGYWSRHMAAQSHDTSSPTTLPANDAE